MSWFARNLKEAFLYPIDHGLHRAPNQILGDAAERIASEYLQKHGLQLICRNFQCRLGEIDIIGVYQSHLLFVEVRAKSRSDYGTPAESVTRRKQRKLILTAQFFLQQHPKWAAYPCRFDIISVTLSESKPNLEWIENAFY